MPEPENKIKHSTRERQPSPFPIWLPLVLVVCGLLVRLIAFFQRETIGIDSVRYLTFAKNYLTGIYFTSGPTGLKELPDIGYPLMIAIGARFFGNDLESIARWASILPGVFTLVIVYLLALRADGHRTAIYALLIAVLCPPLIEYSSLIQTESQFIFLLALGCYLSYEITKRKNNVSLYAISGVCVALAYLTRGIGISLVVIFPLSIFLVSRYDGLTKTPGFMTKFITGLVIFLVGFVIIALPYQIMLYRTYGKVTLSDQSLWHSPRAMHPESDYSKDPRYDGTLTPDGKDYLVNSPEFFKPAPVNPFIWLKAFVTKYVKNQIGIYYYNLRELFPPIILLLIALGLFGRPWEAQYQKMLLLFFIWAFPFLFLQPAFYTEARYIAPLSIFLMVIAGAGVVVLINWCQNIFSKTNPAKVEWVSSTILCILLAPVIIYPITHNGPRYDYVELKKAGNFLSNYISETGGEGILAVTPVTGYYAGTAPNLVLPNADIETVVRFAAKKNISFIALEERKIRDYRPELRPALYTSQFPSSLILIYDNKDNSGYRVRLFKIASIRTQDNLPPRFPYGGE